MRAILIGLLGIFPVAAAAQDKKAAGEQKPPSFSSMRSPSSPAFTLLGLEPSSVERPNTPSSLALSVLNRTQAFSTVPENYALELSPYWLIGRPKLTWRDDTSRGILDSALRTFTVSVATAQTGTETLPVTSLAAGFRLSVASGRVAPPSRESLEALEARLSRQGALFLELMRPRMAELDARLAARAISAEDHNKEQERIALEVLASSAYQAELKAAEKAAQPLAVDREGFFLELAGGHSWDFPEASWEGRRARQWGLWITPSYRKGAWSLVGVGRYLSDERRDTYSLNFGARTIYARDDYALSLECLRRDDQGAGDSGTRLVGVAEYKVAEATWATLSFGKNQASAGRTLVAQIGLSFHFSKDRYKLD